jgi:hypothetical protein
VVVDHPSPAALAVTLRRNPDLAQAARTRNDISRFGIVGQRSLKRPIVIVVEQQLDLTGAEGRFNKDHE